MKNALSAKLHIENKADKYQQVQANSCNLAQGIKGKLKSQKGFTLSEMVVSIVIILLVTGILTVITALAVKTYNSSMRSSEAVILSSTLKSIVTHELAYTKEIKSSGVDEEGQAVIDEFLSPTYAIKDSLSFFYAVTGDGTQMKLTDGFGKIFCGTDDCEKGSLILGDSSYSRGLGAKIVSITYDESTNYFTVKMQVGFKDTVLKDETFIVLNLNKVTIS